MAKKDVQAAVEAAVAQVLTTPESTLDSDGEKAKKTRATVKERKLLDEIAVEIYKLNLGIVSMLKRSTRDAAKIGDHLLRVKPLFDSINVGTSFKTWQKEKCGLSEGTVHNYTKLAEGAAKDPSVLELGLNDAYLKLGIKKPARKRTVDAQADQPGPNNSGPLKVECKLGAHDVFKEKGMYIVELDTDWENAVAEILADTSVLGELLTDGGILIRVLPSNPAFQGLESALAGAAASSIEIR